jgi:hypothetical protein
MATLFLDFEGGNDNHAGTSFATLADGTDGRISSTTFSSAGASFPDDGSLIGQYLSIFNGSIYAVYRITAYVSATSLTIAAIFGGTALANQTVDRQYFIGGRWKTLTTGATAVRTVPGDTIRIMGSPAPTSLGQNGVWTSQALQGTKTLTAATNATPIAISVTGHGYSTGDTVVVTGVVGNTAANGTWEITVTDANTFTLDNSAGNGARTSGGTARLRNNTRVMLASAVTQNIASTGPGRAAWTASADVTATLITTTKEHYESDNIDIAAGFTTGLAAYWPTGTLDLSGYQQVSFWIRQATGTLIAAGEVDLRLCSDAAGVTAVNTISIPSPGTFNRWMPVTVDLGTALGSSIQSIALYVNTDTGAQRFLLSNIIACKASSAADSLTLTSLIGKNTTGETFWGIQSINGTRVMLDADTNAFPTNVNVRGYYGTSETVTTWKRETIKLGPAASNSTAFQTVQNSGTEGNPITISGGWDQTAMSTQDLETWVDGMNGFGIAFSDSSRSFVDFTNVAGVRMQSLFNQAAGPHVYDVVAYNNNSGRIAFNPSTASGYGKVIIGHMVATVAASAHLYEASTAISIIEIKHAVVSNHSTAVSNPQVVTDPRTSLIGASSQSLIANNSTSGLSLTAGGKISNITTRDNTTNGAIFNSSSDSYLFNCILDEAVEVSFGTSAKYAKSVYSHNHDNTPGNHKIFAHGGLISAATDQRNTASGISWKFQPTSTSLVSSRFPLTLSLAKVACAANSLVTVKAWMRRTSISLTMRLVCQGGQIAGVDADVISAMTASSNTWQERTITFTPTEVGVVEIIAEAFGGTIFSGWVDDLTISQA